MSEINHEAAKLIAKQAINIYGMAGGHLNVGHLNISRAYLDLHEQLAAERARVDALVWLVRLAFTTGRTFGMNCYELGEHSAFSFYESDVPKELAAILEGRTAHAQGDEG